jgi:hypothetical protein
MVQSDFLSIYIAEMYLYSILFETPNLFETPKPPNGGCKDAVSEFYLSLKLLISPQAPKWGM